MSEQEKFVLRYVDCFEVYKKYKKDYLLVSFLHYQFRKENPEISKELLDSKLKVIINTYRAKRNNIFDKEKYISCNFVWENINNYLLNIFSIIGEKKLNDDSLDEFDKNYLNNVEMIISEMSMDINTKSSKKIKETLRRLKS